MELLGNLPLKEAVSESPSPQVGFTNHLRVYVCT